MCLYTTKPQGRILKRSKTVYKVLELYIYNGCGTENRFSLITPYKLIGITSLPCTLYAKYGKTDGKYFLEEEKYSSLGMFSKVLGKTIYCVEGEGVHAYLTKDISELREYYDSSMLLGSFDYETTYEKITAKVIAKAHIPASSTVWDYDKNIYKHYNFAPDIAADKMIIDKIILPPHFSEGRTDEDIKCRKRIISFVKKINGKLLMGDKLCA